MKNSNKNPPELDALWKAGKPLLEAFNTYCRPRNITAEEIPTPKHPNWLDVTRPIMNFLNHKASENARRENNFLRKIIKESLVAIGYEAPRQLNSALTYIPTDIWSDRKINWKSSEIEGNGLKFVAVRIIPKKAKELISESELKIQIKKPGRPSSKKYILGAYQKLKEINKIDFHAPLKPQIPLIQDTAKRLSGITRIQGIGPKAIQAHIGPLFRADKDKVRS